MKNNWREQLRDEFGIHFKGGTGELQFLEAFVEDLIEKEKEKIIQKLRKVKGIDKEVLKEIIKIIENEETPPQI